MNAHATHGAHCACHNGPPSSVPHPILKRARPGQFVGVELRCPRYDCDWRENHGSAQVVNEYGVRDPIPAFCKRCGLHVEVERIVEVVGGRE
jgi:hypothetical protein